MARKIIIAVLLVLFFVCRVQAQGPIKVYLPMIVTADIDNNWRIIQPLASSNKVLNPSAEITGNFSAVGGATATRSTDFQKYGLFSYRVQPAASGDGIELDSLTLANAHHFVTLRVRGTFTNLRASLNGNLRPLTLIEKVDSNWDLYGASFGASLANGATAVQITDTASGNFYIDGIQVEPQTVWTTYIDGTQEGCAWQGIPHAASSERSGESRAGGISYDLFEQYQFQVQKVVGAGASGHNLSIDSYAILPGGELNSDKIESRDFNIVGMFITNTEEELHEKRQELEAAFQTDDNQLTRIRFNGAAAQKEIAVRYNGGLEGDLAAFYGNIEIVADDQYMDRELFTEKSSIQVVAPIPYWFEVGESVALLDTNDSATFRNVAARLKATGQWNVLGPPSSVAFAGNIYGDFAEDETYIYFGSNFTNFDGIANADRIVRWHKVNETWSALGTGLNDLVTSMTIGPDGNLYVVGWFTTAGGGGANRIAVWNTTSETWGTLGTGFNNAVYDLTFGVDGTIYAAGQFSTADGNPVDRFSSWDGSSWNDPGIAFGNTIFALATGLDGLIYIGGQFTNVGDANGDLVVVWDPVTSTLSSMSTGISGAPSVVNSIAVRFDGIVFISGVFDTAGGILVNNICSWNGTGFSRLGDGVNDTTYMLDVGQDGLLYVAGLFTIGGGSDLTDRIAKWNNFVWSHVDINIPTGGPPFYIFAVTASKFVDPVIEQKYDIFIGFNTQGTGNFGGLVTAVNEGSVQAFPKIIYARSGGTSATIETLRNERTGKELLFDYSLLDGETLEIDLEPTQKSIISSFFGSRLDAVLANSDFGIWVLPRGNSDVTSFVSTVGGPTVTAYMQWRDAYSGYD